MEIDIDPESLTCSIPTASIQGDDAEAIRAIAVGEQFTLTISGIEYIFVVADRTETTIKASFVWASCV